MSKTTNELNTLTETRAREIAAAMETADIEREIRHQEHRIDVHGADSQEGRAAQFHLDALCAELGTRKEC